MSREYFNLQSYSLDYISQQLGYGGKNKMDFSDWEAINLYRMHQLSNKDRTLLSVLSGRSLTEIKVRGREALIRMKEYGRKDTEDTIRLLKRASKYFTLKHQHGGVGIQGSCGQCGSTNLIRNGTRHRGTDVYQRLECKEHNGFAGYVKILANGKLGKITIGAK